MLVLGFSLKHDAGATLVENGRIISAINEERLSREKNHVRWINRYEWQTISPPYASITETLKIAGVNLSEVEAIAIPFLHPMFSTVRGFAELWKANFQTKSIISYGRVFLTNLINSRRHVANFLNTMNIEKRIHFVDHHLAHAASAYFTSPWDDCLIVTLDTAGDYLSGTVSLGRNGNIKRVHQISGYFSIGAFYSFITELLGFKRMQHEGKVTGLAAYGHRNEELLAIFSKFIQFNNSSFFSDLTPHLMKDAQSRSRLINKYQDWLSSFSKQDIAANAQILLEEYVVKYIHNNLKRYRKKNLVLSGGVFANVKLNQRLAELDEVQNIYIFPHMGDGGLSAGAALWICSRLNHNELEFLHPLSHLYLGTNFSNRDIENVLDSEGINYKYMRNIEKEIAVLVANKKVVARFNGAMEYGPRALGDRSILYSPHDRSVNDWLNKKLKRTEFMPFAPATLEEYARQCYLNINPAKYTSKFMTITFNCTSWMHKNCPAVIHVDGTSRPQLIGRDQNPSFYEVIDEFRKITGNPTVLNTSFNIHEEPIVRSPRDALKAFFEGDLDYLAISNFLIENQRLKDVS